MSTLMHKQYPEEIPNVNEETSDISSPSPTQNHMISFANRQNLLISSDSSFTQQILLQNGDNFSNNSSLVNGVKM